MIGKVNLDDGDNRELANRIVTRLMTQGEEEIKFVLKKLFPDSPVMRIRSMAVDFAAKRENSTVEFLNLFDTDNVNMNIFTSLSSADKSEAFFLGRGQYDPTKFALTLTCARTPFKEFFIECATVTCESCIERRIQDFVTTNEFSKTPFSVKIDRVEATRIDICKGCGSILNKKDEINMQNERLLYQCSYCGHKGWKKAK